jgi:hypothetical protein
MYVTNKRFIIAVSLILIIAAAGLSAAALAERTAAKLNVGSQAFMNGDRIPVKYTCDGEDISPPLSWSPGPADAKTYALVMDDPDAQGAFAHWVVYNIPASVTYLSEHMTAAGTSGDGTMQGKNSFGNIRYGGPCPPAGKPHHYRFSVYALDSGLPLSPGASMGDVLNAISGHVLAKGELVGTYSR